MKFLLTGLSGMIGASLRYLMSLYCSFGITGGFPAATFLTNMAGSFILGCLTAFLPRFSLPPAVVTALTSGLIGSFTTFSAFTVETMELLQNGKAGTAFLYIGASLFGGLFFAWCGLRAGTAGKEAEEQ